MRYLFAILIMLCLGCERNVPSPPLPIPVVTPDSPCLGVFDMEHFSRVQDGMTYAEVVSIIGKPSRVDEYATREHGSVKLCTWHSSGHMEGDKFVWMDVVLSFAHDRAEIVGPLVSGEAYE